MAKYRKPMRVRRAGCKSTASEPMASFCELFHLGIPARRSVEHKAVSSLRQNREIESSWKRRHLRRCASEQLKRIHYLGNLVWQQAPHEARPLFIENGSVRPAVLLEQLHERKQKVQVWVGTHNILKPVIGTLEI
jgi:hypothetical protein